jgi:hypothetical protein
MPCDHDSKCLDDRIVVDISSAPLPGGGTAGASAKSMNDYVPAVKP